MRLTIHMCQSLLTQGEYWQDGKGVSQLQEILELINLYVRGRGEQGLC